MGRSPFLLAFLPTYATWGIAEPMCLNALRLMQGLALSGEYGGAATHVTEHSPHKKRGAYTPWIQTTATANLVSARMWALMSALMSALMWALTVILGTRLTLGEKKLPPGAGAFRTRCPASCRPFRCGFA